MTPVNPEKHLARLVPGIGKAIRQARRELLAACLSPDPVVLAGEAGTGKDHAARALHDISPGPRGAFVRVDLSRPEWPDPPGAGATVYLDRWEAAGRSRQQAAARFADGLPPGCRVAVSVSLPARDDGSVPAPPRFLGRRCRTVLLPPLRRHPEDLPLLAGLLGRREGAPSVLAMTPEDLAHLVLHSWPGNLSELAAWVEERLAAAPGPHPGGDGRPEPLGRVLDREVDRWVSSLLESTPRERGILPLVGGRVERSVIRAVLRATGGNQLESAAVLGINRNTLATKIKGHGLSDAARRRGGRKPGG